MQNCELAVAPASMDTDTRIASVERVCQTEADRNIGPLVPFAAGGLVGAAQSIAAAGEPNVVVLTGAYIPWATPPAAETDGPPGAALLASGLQGLGITARLLTDRRCMPAVMAAQEEASQSLPVDVCSGDSGDVARLLESYEHLGVTHVVSVERMGPAQDNVVRNFRGEDITSFTPSFQPLFDEGRAWTTIGVGDGGNELGMGNVPASVVKSAIDHGERIHCTIACDFLIVAGVSNWGALGLLLAVGMLRDGSKAVLSERVSARSHREVVEACVRAGAVDGTVGRSIASVDGLGFPEHDVVIEKMRQAAGMETSS